MISRIWKSIQLVSDVIICLIRDWLFSTDGKRSVEYDSGQFYCLFFSSLKCKYLFFSAQLPFRVYFVARHIYFPNSKFGL